MLFSSLCCIVASLVAHRLDSNYNSASMLWLLPQFLLWGMMKGILEEGLEEFLHDHIDNDLQVQAVYGIVDTVGNFLSMILTVASPSNWVGSGNDISKSHLDNYYRMLAITTLFSTFLFTIVAIAKNNPTKTPSPPSLSLSKLTKSHSNASLLQLANKRDMALRAKKKEIEFKVPETLTLCINNYGLTGNLATNNMCQKCFNATIATTSSSPSSTASSPSSTANITTAGAVAVGPSVLTFSGEQSSRSAKTHLCNKKRK
ncbi:hypothetical protein SLEP1_g41027 [Rubroshorea leprosula]|uniref:Uncharacterized protein n=1 Tax=Rubroshorea leprosula TaxID=152421 RepID=A0AAV5L593_9ROSI|nr:hypothetical protein SLEP1_g41027 [Rubroshorea leprosula]